ncbi:hypothetical protein K461DRAFT_312384 [Myriangium duriaei CBS 260.36]|uniref:Uncharacterized protein n=1 Tax=Myriangium duriaei CBS 260.36 TaxID=1168546 RepID=A0A9P4J5M8_9PEZI|nr:hypothetical protein K461DRAFT_312384 [Myriangium duriaei CBS 260.36]
MQYSTLFLLGASLAATVSAGDAKDAPPYCQPDKTDSFNEFSWADVSDECKANGSGTNCCVTIIQGGPTSWDHPQEGGGTTVSDLQLTMDQQAGKDGQFKISKINHWTCSFPLATSALKNQMVVTPWLDGINRIKATNPTWNIVNAYFNADGNQIYCNYI